MNNQGYKEKDYDLVFADSVAETAEKSKAIFARKNRPDACIAMGDDRLLGIAKSITQLGIKIPEEMSIIALSDGFIPTTLPFNMPYVLTSGHDMGKASVSLLFDLIEQKDGVPFISYIDTPVMNTAV